MIREQKRQVSKVLLDGLYDPDCLLSMLRGVRTEVIGEIVWKEMLAWNWQFFPGQCFFDLCKEGDLEGVRASLQKGTEVNKKDEYGRTGLIVALMNNHNPLVEFLLKIPNIDVNQKDDLGWCAQKDDDDDYLYGDYDDDDDDDDGVCALHLAVRKRNIEVLKLLLDFPNIDVNNVNNDGQSALHAAVMSSFEALELLLNHTNIDVNIVDNKGHCIWL